MLRTEAYPTPSRRPLRVYAFDPSVGRKLNNYMLVPVPYEKLQPGPVGSQLAVIDYDASNGRFYTPVDLDHPSVLIAGGLEPSESDPRFHQQMVYAVASETLRRFEFALGRPIRWRTRPGSPKTDPFHKRLRIFPHAFQQANAFYDPSLRALLFGYFAASKDDPGEALPGQTIFTCLSHDIVAHETTHALVDGQREFLTEATGPDAAAFHEAFADIVALFQHFSYKDALLDTINRTGGLIYRKNLVPLVSKAGEEPAVIPELTEDNPLVGLARQFGQAIGARSALRSAIGTPPNSKDIESVFEPHLRGAILVSAVFDAFFTIYIKRTRGLVRISQAGSPSNPPGDLHPDLAELLAREAAKIAENFLNISIRALDYFPPVDIRFGEFLRAVVTADSDLVPEDPYDYRAELIKAFRLRGIIPEDVTSYSEEALRWSGPESRHKQVGRCQGLQYDVVKSDDPQEQEVNEQRSRRNAEILSAFAKANAKALGLAPALPIKPHSYHPIHRISPEGRLVIDFVVEFLQQKEERLDPHDVNSPQFKFRGGSTVIFDHLGNVRYAIEKSVASRTRLEQQRQHQLNLAARSAAAAYRQEASSERLNFRMIHRGLE
jgi:hypothetical protein